MYQEVFKLHACLLKALAHPKRLEIIQLLRNQKLSVSQMQQMLDLPQANLSQHLQILRETEVVKTQKKGKEIYYQLANKNFIKASDLLREILVKKYKNSPLADEFTLKMNDLIPITTDPVCGMRLSPKTAAFAYKYQDQEYYFCASKCFKLFKQKCKK